MKLHEYSSNLADMAKDAGSRMRTADDARADGEATVAWKTRRLPPISGMGRIRYRAIG